MAHRCSFRGACPWSIQACCTAIAGGKYNWTNGDATAICGGKDNKTWGDATAISGGKDNMTYGEATAISGGKENVAGSADPDVDGATSAASITGGKQVYNGKYAPGWGTPADITWKVNVQSAGTYGLTLQAAVANVEQTVLISINGGNPVPVSIANSHGLWQETRPLDIAMKPGENTINLTRPETGRGLALRYLEVRKKS